MQKMLLRVLFICTLTTGAHAARVDDCLDIEELNQRWKTKYYSDIKLDQPLEELQCQSMQYKIAKAMDILFLVSEDTDHDFYSYVVTQIPLLTIELEKKFEGVEETNAYAYIRKMGKKEKKRVALYKSFFKSQSSVNDELYDHFVRASVLAHESKHMELKRHADHVVCEDGVSAGETHCDVQYYNQWNNGGACSTEVNFLKYARNSSISNPTIDGYLSNRIKFILKNNINEGQ